MKKIILDDGQIVKSLYPFTKTRHAAEIRVGIFTIREKWQALSGLEVVMARSINGQDMGLYGKDQPGTDPPSFDDTDTIVVRAGIIPTRDLVKQILSSGRLPDPLPPGITEIKYPWHIFQLNDAAIRQDFELTSSRISEIIPEAVQVIQAASVFIEEGAVLTHCMLNATTGPIYIGKNAQIMEGSYIRGPFALCENAVVKMGTRVYGATTIGPACVAGGEIKNSVMFGHSNKAHDGYLGDSVIGEWCNLGAGTSNSNMKNTTGDVRVWNGLNNDFVPAGQKCGLIMGDYSRSSINSSFNTGTVVGVCCNVFGGGLTEKYIPDFTWGNHTLSRYEFEKALKDISGWKKLKNQSLSESEIQRLKSIFDEL